jgi:hypothetical protein
LQIKFEMQNARDPNPSNEEVNEGGGGGGRMECFASLGWSAGQKAAYSVDIFSPTTDPRQKSPQGPQYPLKQKTPSASYSALPPVGFPVPYEHSCLRCESEKSL